MQYGAARSDVAGDRALEVLIETFGWVDQIAREVNEKGLSLVPLRIYFTHGMAKVEVALARGKRKYEKRQSIAKREAQREMERAAGRRR